VPSPCRSTRFVELASRAERVTIRLARDIWWMSYNRHPTVVPDRCQAPSGRPECRWEAHLRPASAPPPARRGGLILPPGAAAEGVLRELGSSEGGNLAAISGIEKNYREL
jgi:hypothetical protein